MLNDFPDDYLAGLTGDQRKTLARTNGPGLEALRAYLAAGDAAAFLGAGVSAPLYPLWQTMIGELVDAAEDRLTEREAATCRALATTSPEEVVEILRQVLGTVVYREVLREVLRTRTDPVSGRSWTPVQELVCRCSFKGVVTTNYDPGIVDARMRVRAETSATGFTTWQDELGLDRWRTGRAFDDAELPVLYAHGQCNRPDSVVLATAEYRRAYEGKLAHVLRRLVDDGHLVWIGFSFADQRIAAILREVANWSGTRADPGAAAEHVAIMPWDPQSEGNDPGILARRAEISYRARVVLYPAPEEDHSALAVLLEALTDARFPPAADLSRARSDGRTATGLVSSPGAGSVPVMWVPGTETVGHFTGRAEELARLDRWAADPYVALVGVSAWGGAGKTALVTHWVHELAAASRRPGIKGVFGWSFYADSSAEHWAGALVDWAGHKLGVRVAADTPAGMVLALLRAVPLLLVLDGMEVIQEGPAGDGFGRLLDGTLREVLTGACRLSRAGLVILTSRFPFADLEPYDGDSARMLDVPPFTPTDGAALLLAAGGGWLDENARRSLVRAMDGHALAVGVMAAALAGRPPTSDLVALQDELAAATRTSARVSRVLRFYAEQLSEPDRYLMAAVSLFARPVPAEAVLAVAGHEAFAGRLAGWTPATVHTAVRNRLGGLISPHPDGTISAHPLVRDTFRSLVTDAADMATDTTLTGVPEGIVTGSADGLRVVEAIELLLDAGQWRSAHGLYQARSNDGVVWRDLPAARLGERAAVAFVASPARRAGCRASLGPSHYGFYLNAVGLHAMIAGDLVTAREYLSMFVRHARNDRDARNLSISLRNLGECLGHLGEIDNARMAMSEALSSAASVGDDDGVRNSHAFLGWLAGLAGETAVAEEEFIAADRIEVENNFEGHHLCSMPGIRWAEWLIRTGRLSPARLLTERNREVSARHNRNQDVAQCDQLDGRCALATGQSAVASDHLAAAAACFRGGDYLIDLATAVTDLAECARMSGELQVAEAYVEEAIVITSARGLALAQSAALSARARICADQAAGASGPERLAQGRDAADAALRLAAWHHLAWQELDALHAHAYLDQAERIDRGWADRAEALRTRLMPPGLDPDPLATVERLVNS
jgi:hypothetical protein